MSSVVAKMSGVFEVYDNEQVQLVTRRQAAVTFVVLIGAVAATLLLILLVRERLIAGWLAAVMILAIDGVAVFRLVRHLRRTNHVVWCVKISESQVAGYDYARRETSLFWTDVRQIELGGDALRIRGKMERHIEIPHLFPDFSSLSHRIVEHAERHHVPVLIDGRPVEDLDLYSLYPFLSPGVGAR